MSQISIIVPVYKVEQYIHRCVNSILGQSYSDFELILVDDGSPDNCGRICDEYAQKDPRVRVIHQKNGGLSAARNTGIDWSFANSDSQWLTFIDSDDWIHSDYLSSLYSAATNANLPLSICGYVRTSGDEQVLSGKPFSTRLWISEDFFAEENVNATVAWGKLYRKESFRDIRYPVGKLHEDEFTTYKLLFSTEQVAVVEAPLYYYYQNADGIMGSAWSPKRLHVFDACDEQLRFFAGKNFPKAESKRAVAYGYILQSHFQLLASSKIDNKPKYTRILRSKAKLLLKQYRKNVFSPFQKYAWMYELAYPKLMTLYWYFHTFLHKCKIK